MGSSTPVNRRATAPRASSPRKRDAPRAISSWLGLVEVADGATHFGAVFACDVDAVPASFTSDEIGAIGVWRPDSRPRPLGECDAALLNRFG